MLTKCLRVEFCARDFLQEYVDTFLTDDQCLKEMKRVVTRADAQEFNFVLPTGKANIKVAREQLHAFGKQHDLHTSVEEARLNTLCLAYLFR